jgi:hypothetical protein
MPPARRGMTADDEAKFALLEPDGTSPLKSRLAADAQKAVSQKKGGLALLLGLVFVLYLFSLRASDSRAAATAAASSMTMSARGVSAGDDVVVVSSETATATSLVSVPVVSRSSATADVGDTVVVNKETAVEVAQTTATEPVVPARDTDGDVYVIRHSAGGDDNVDSPPPPPPPSRAGILRFFSWLRGRKKEGAGRVAKLISKLQNEINDGATFAPAEMAQRLAEIERLERMEARG